MPQNKLTIHGISDLITATTLRQCLFWLIVVLCAFVLMLYEMFFLIRQYQNFPINSEIRMTFIEFYPAVTYCPDWWINATKAKDLDLTKNDIRVLLSHFNNRSNFRKIYINNLDLSSSQASSLIDVPENRSDSTILDSAQQLRKKVWLEFEKKFQVNQADKFRKFILHLSASLTSNYTGNNGSVETIATIEGPCHVLRNNNPISFFNLHIAYMAYSSKDSSLFDYQPTKDYVYIGSGESILPGVSIAVHVVPGQNNVIQVSATKHNKISTSRSPCKSWTLQNRELCISECFNNFCLNTTGFVYIFAPMKNDSLLNLAKLSDHMNDTNYCSVSCDMTVVDSCYRGCPRLCEEWYFRASVTTGFPSFSGIPTSRTELEVLFENPENTAVIEESRAFSWETMVCNLGGMVSLFFGASLISVVQLFAFLWEFYAKKMKNKTIIASASDNKLAIKLDSM